MKLLAIFILLATLVLGATMAASAGTATGTTTLIGTATAGAYVDVDAAVVSDAPVVAYDYALQNDCFFSGKAAGQPDSYQRDDIPSWDYSDGDVPHTIMTVNLLTVPAGSVCKVFLAKNNVVVKGSVTSYTVQ